MAWDEGLTGVYREIAESAARRIGILAGPGSGKTSRGLMRRIARLLETGSAEPHDILLLTFTRTAAQDLVSKLQALGTPGAEGVVASTVHAYCLGLLRREAVLAVTGRTPRMLLEFERDVMLRDVEGDFGDIYARRALLHAMEAGWARQQTDHPGAPIDATDRSFEAQTMDWLRHHDAMLIGEVVPIGFEFLRTSPEFEDRQRFRHIIVDEYQDLNPLEQVLIELLVGENTSLCVAGDDDQSIYRFRHANREGIVVYLEEVKENGFTINECHRCPDNVIRLGNDLIGAAPGRRKPPMIPAAGRDGPIAIVQWPTADAEIDGLAAAVVGDIQAERRVAGDFLILVHRRRVGYRIRETLAALGVESHSFFQDNALKDSKPAQEAFTLLTLLAHPNDRVAARVWLGFGDQTARAEAYRALRRSATEESVTERDILNAAAREDRRLSWRSLTDRWRQLLARSEALASATVEELVDSVFPSEDPDLDLLRDLASLLVADAENLRDLHDRMLKAITQPEVPQHPDYVRVMSLHKSKGLSSPVVVVALAVEGVVPTYPPPARANEREIEAAVEEGRRLFYVAVTRAQDELVISYPRTMTVPEAKVLRVSQGRLWRQGDDLVGSCIPTQYLRELGEGQPAPIRGEAWLEGRS